MKDILSSKERLKIAIAYGKPDLVPAIPDFSNMIPCKLTGKPFWDIYLSDTPSLFETMTCFIWQILLPKRKRW